MCVHKDRRMCCGCEECTPDHKSKAHPHAELMMQYAQDAMETDKPWELWQRFSEMFSKWVNLKTHPQWESLEIFRRKPKTININGYEVPEPVKYKEFDVSELFYVDMSVAQSAGCVLSFNGLAKDSSSYVTALRRAGCFLNNGMAHTTREAAELHAKALLSFTIKE